MGHECLLFNSVYVFLFYSGFIVFVENAAVPTELYESIATTKHLKMTDSKIETNATMNNYHLLTSTTSTIKLESSKTSTGDKDHLKNIHENITWHFTTVLPNFTSHSKEKPEQTTGNIINPFVATTVSTKNTSTTAEGLIISLVILFIIIIIISIVVILRKKKVSMFYFAFNLIVNKNPPTYRVGFPRLICINLYCICCLPIFFISADEQYMRTKTISIPYS
ncbi:uncharacterized protein LOC128484483 isoform X2 [Spea bombifrons]|uniref:uncharacterized protein LOC128484483 isoform X2 n=1 Tax=Spea bombifrons TaxID=233779 RepID=UPI00234B9EBC|nr:uncharacterized protein LOC128484483 isoform X2 [Spea bombifrons]